MLLKVKTFGCRGVFAMVVLAGLSACAGSNRSLYRTPYPWERESDDAQSVMRADGPDVVRVTTVDGTRFVLEDAVLDGQFLGGTAVREDDTPSESGFRVAIQDIARIEWRVGRRNMSWVKLPILAALVFFASRGLQALLFGSG